MAFSGAFRRPFSPPFGGGGEELPWWNIDGLTPGGVGGTCAAAYQPKAGGLYNPTNIAESYINRANPGTNDAAPGVAPAWAAGTGWAFNGLTQYLISGVVPNPGTSSMLVQFSNTLNTAVVAGSRVGGFNQEWYIHPNYFIGPTVRYAIGGNRWQVAPQLLTGNLGIVGLQGYRNGAADGPAAGIPSAGSKIVYIGCLNDNGIAAIYYAGMIIALAIYSVTLTAPQVLARATAMALI